MSSTYFPIITLKYRIFLTNHLPYFAKTFFTCVINPPKIFPHCVVLDMTFCTKSQLALCLSSCSFLAPTHSHSLSFDTRSPLHLPIPIFSHSPFFLKDEQHPAPDCRGPGRSGAGASGCVPTRQCPVCRAAAHCPRGLGAAAGRHKGRHLPSGRGCAQRQPCALRDPHCTGLKSAAVAKQHGGKCPLQRCTQRQPASVFASRSGFKQKMIKKKRPDDNFPWPGNN